MKFKIGELVIFEDVIYRVKDFNNEHDAQYKLDVYFNPRILDTWISVNKNNLEATGIKVE